ncbi:MAG: hypothetical protein AB1Z98_16150 [Nannocystaceae bacterium]
MTEAGSCARAPGSAPSSLLRRRFRANPVYELVGLAELPPRWQRRLGSLDDREDAHAVLCPRDPSLRLKALCRGSAELFASLAEPGPLSPSLHEASTHGAADAIARLVLDGVLQVWHDERFVDGPEALAVVASPRDAAAAAHGRVGELSREAIAYGAALSLHDPRELSRRLYGYNRVAVSAWQQRSLPDEASLEAFVGLRAPAFVEALGEDFVRLSRPGARGRDAFWIRWVRRTGRDPESGAPLHKLYLSPTLEHLREVLPVAAAVAREHGSMSFKLGRQLGGLLRPDKLVMYFRSASQADAAAAELLDRLASVPAQGVPFTVAVDERGLVSRGFDPPPDSLLVPWQGPSWRRFITDRLALALVDARGLDPPRSREQHALERLRLEGIDPHTFTPAASLWREDSRGPHE